MRPMLALALVLLSTGLAGSQSRPPPPPPVALPPADLSRVPVEIVSDVHVTLDGLDAEKVRALLARPSITAIESARFLADRTRLVDVPEVGTNVIYTSADGRAFLWQPGEVHVFAGHWKVKTRRESLSYTDPGTAPRPELALEAGPGASFEFALLCISFSYASTGAASAHGADPETCATLAEWQKGTREAVRTDRYQLSTRPEAPFLLTRDRATLADLDLATR